MTDSPLPIGPDANPEVVRDLHRRLTQAGVDVNGPHDRFTEATTDAVKRFQESRRLRADGTCGSQTWSALVEAGWRLGDRLLYERSPWLRGDDVADLQGRLGSLGFLADRLDGIFGPRTAGAVAEFQRNVGLTSDSIVGPATLDALGRLDSHARGAVKARLLDEETVRQRGPNLSGQRVVVGETGGLSALCTSVERSVAARGAEVISTHHPDPSTQAREANDFAASVYVGIGIGPADGVACSYYATERFESTGGRRLAEVLAPALGRALANPAGGSAQYVATVTPMRLPVLRETRAPAVWCDLAPAARVVEATPDLVEVLTDCLQAWMDPTGTTI